MLPCQCHTAFSERLVFWQCHPSRFNYHLVSIRRRQNMQQSCKVYKSQTLIHYTSQWVRLSIQTHHTEIFFVKIKHWYSVKTEYFLKKLQARGGGGTQKPNRFHLGCLWEPHDKMVLSEIIKINAHFLRMVFVTHWIKDWPQVEY